MQYIVALTLVDRGGGESSRSSYTLASKGDAGCQMGALLAEAGVTDGQGGVRAVRFGLHPIQKRGKNQGKKRPYSEWRQHASEEKVIVYLQHTH